MQPMKNQPFNQNYKEDNHFVNLNKKMLSKLLIKQMLKKQMMNVEVYHNNYILSSIEKRRIIR